MKMNKAFYGAVILVTLLCATSCNNKQFHVNGTISEAKDSILYLENMSLNGPQVVDSVKLGEDGTFAFGEQSIADNPEFYRLRIANQIINVSIDSTETVTFKASYPTMLPLTRCRGRTTAPRSRSWHSCNRGSRHG